MSQETYHDPVQPKEIERKFLVTSLPDNLDSYDNSMIRQGYVVIGTDGSEVRVRAKSTMYSLTVKSLIPGDNNGIIRYEKEETIPQDLFTSLWETTVGKRVEKVRFEIPYENTIIELDIYLGDLYGLITAEVEFPDEQSAIQFTPPEWLGDDVTNNKAYKNQNLAQFGKPV